MPYFSIPCIYVLTHRYLPRGLERIPGTLLRISGLEESHLVERQMALPHYVVVAQFSSNHHEPGRAAIYQQFVPNLIIQLQGHLTKEGSPGFNP